MPRKKQTIENQLNRLNDIIEEIDSGEAELESAIKLYKEGVTLIEDCAKTLTAIDEEIVILQNQAEQPFLGGAAQ